MIRAAFAVALVLAACGQGRKRIDPRLDLAVEASRDRVVHVPGGFLIDGSCTPDHDDDPSVCDAVRVEGDRQIVRFAMDGDFAIVEVGFVRVHLSRAAANDPSPLGSGAVRVLDRDVDLAQARAHVRVGRHDLICLSDATRLVNAERALEVCASLRAP